MAVMASKEDVKPAAVKVEESVDSSAAEAPSTTEATPAVASPSVAPSESEGSTGGVKTEGTKSRRVYVGNLAWDVSWQDLKDLMKTTGFDVTRSDIMKFGDGRSKGYGIVEFATVEGAQQAVLTLNDKDLKGRPIFVREDREARGQGFSSGEQAQGRRVYVGNLSWDVNWNILKDHMRQAGEVVHAEIMSEPSGRSKGCGVVEYATDQEAQVAISTLTHTELNGRTIFVREDRETSSASGPKSGPPAAAKASSQNSGVYVWNLSYDTSWQDLKDHMRKAGNVDQATILMTDGTSAGIGVVYYQKPSEAARAIRELQDTTLKGRQIKLREDRAPPGGRGGGRGRGRGTPRAHGGGGGGGGRGGGHHSASLIPSGTQVYVGNVASETNWRDLKDLFKQCGEVDRAEVRQGFGTVRFSKKEDAQAAIAKLNGAKLHDRTLEVRLDDRS